MPSTLQPVFRRLRLSDEPQAAAAHRALAAEDFDFLPLYSPRMNWADYVDRINSYRSAQNVPHGWVRSEFFMALCDEKITGRLWVRYELTEALQRRGGHLGYAVLPEYRGRRVAAQLCAFGLEQLAETGVTRALLTCDATNTASQAVIRSCGGLLDEQRPEVLNHDGSSTLRFWIRTPAKL